MLHRIDQEVNAQIQELSDYGDIDEGVIEIIETADNRTQHSSTRTLVHAVKNCEAAANALKQEAERYQKKAERMQQIARGIRAGLLTQIENGSRQAGQHGAHRVCVRTGPPVVIVHCKPEELPGEYQNTTVVANKVKIREDLKSGAKTKIEGVKCERRKHLVIASASPTSL